MVVVITSNCLMSTYLRIVPIYFLIIKSTFTSVVREYVICLIHW
jgi:hypothetical protein